MKKTYISPACDEMIKFETEDVITNSGIGENIDWDDGVDVSVN